MASDPSSRPTLLQRLLGPLVNLVVERVFPKGYFLGRDAVIDVLEREDGKVSGSLAAHLLVRNVIARDATSVDLLLQGFTVQDQPMGDWRVTVKREGGDLPQRDADASQAKRLEERALLLARHVMANHRDALGDAEGGKALRGETWRAAISQGDMTLLLLTAFEFERLLAQAEGVKLAARARPIVGEPAGEAATRVPLSGAMH